MTVLARIWRARRFREVRTRVATPVGVQHGALIQLDRFSALGADLPNFVVQSLALADEYGIDGLLGMNFVERFHFTIRPIEGEICLEPCDVGWRVTSRRRLS